jgi:hypothetical protein
MQFLNLTPHPVTIFAGETPRTFAPSGTVARVFYDRETTWAAGIPLVRDVSSRVENLPEAKPGVYLIVSGMVFESAADRTDLAAPVQPVRERGSGYVIGCKMLRTRG